MKPTTFIVAAVAALFLTAAGANAASPTFGIGSSTSGPPLPNEANPGAIGGSPQSLQPLPSGGLGTGPGYTRSAQTYGATTGTSGSSIFSPNVSGSTTSGAPTSGMSAGG